MFRAEYEMKESVDTLVWFDWPITLDGDGVMDRNRSESVQRRARRIQNGTQPATGMRSDRRNRGCFEIVSRAHACKGILDQLKTDERRWRGKNTISSEVRCILESNVRHPALESLWARKIADRIQNGMDVRIRRSASCVDARKMVPRWSQHRTSNS